MEFGAGFGQDGHVWAEQPVDRFVILNSSRLGEGSTHSNGIKVIEIQKDGLALEYAGTRFFSPK